MASSRSPATIRPITITPKSRVLDVSTPSTNAVNSLSFSHSDDLFSKPLRDAGLDEDSIRRRDKAALIAYIAKLEAEVYELQHNMGLLILERKDYASKYEEARLASESVKAINARDLAALSSSLSEAKKREENLKKALGVEKECVANIEKALHEMRAECAEAKVSAESKMAEARSMVEDAQRKYIEIEAKLHAAEALQDESKRRERAAARKLQEVEAREDDLRRRIVSFKSECDAKENGLLLERQSLLERQKVVSEGHNKLLDGQALLNQREAEVLSKSQELRCVEKELEAEKEKISAERKALMDQKSNFELTAYSLSEREKAVIEKEALLIKKEHELLISQEKLASIENNETQRILAEQERLLSRRRDEFEADLLMKQKLVEEDIESKRRSWELKELDLKQREDLVLEKEQDLEVQSRLIVDKGKDLAQKIKSLQERESYLNKSEKEVELLKSQLQKEREEIDQVKIELERSLISLEGDKKKFAEAKEELKLMKSETSELLIWESKLKEEIDIIRAQNVQLEAEAEKLKVEKAKFETEWEFIDEKREELKREEERIAGERLVITKFLKDERDSLNAEKEALRDQYKRDLEVLSQDQEAFRSESQRERSEWFSKFQQEREDFLLDIECRKRELEDCVNQRREDIENYLREKEKAFEEEKKRELQYISSLKEEVVREQELVTSELKKLGTEKLEIKIDREQRDKAWAELQNLIEELQMQRLKLKEQRELLHADREEIHSQIEHLQKLEDLKVNSDRIVVPVLPKDCVEYTPELIVRIPCSESAQKVTLSEDRQGAENDSPPSSTVSWIKKCASLIFKNSPDQGSLKDVETMLEGDREDGKKEFVGQSSEIASEEPKVIHEVPSVSQDATDICDPEAKSVHESSIPASSGTSASRKRRVDDPSITGVDSILPDVGKVNKKRRQLGVDVPDSSQDVASQRETSNVKEFGLVNEAVRDSDDLAPEVNNASKLLPDVQQSVDENEALRCVIVKQTVVQEVVVMDGGESNILQKESANEPENEEHGVPLDTESEKPADVKEKVKTRSRTKQKM